MFTEAQVNFIQSGSVNRNVPHPMNPSARKIYELMLTVEIQDQIQNYAIHNLTNQTHEIATTGHKRHNYSIKIKKIPKSIIIPIFEDILNHIGGITHCSPLYPCKKEGRYNMSVEFFHMRLHDYATLFLLQSPWVIYGLQIIQEKRSTSRFIKKPGGMKRTKIEPSAYISNEPFLSFNKQKNHYCFSDAYYTLCSEINYQPRRRYRSKNLPKPDDKMWYQNTMCDDAKITHDIVIQPKHKKNIKNPEINKATDVVVRNNPLQKSTIGTL